jgi:membrane associated rhomboid family serine protease
MPVNSLDPSSHAAETASLVLSLRAAWLTALLSEPDSVLMHCDPVVAHLVSENGEQLVLLSADSRDLVAARITALMHNPPPGPLHVLVVGGSEELVPVLRSLEHAGQNASFWRITKGGALERVAGTQSKALARASDVLGTKPPLSERELAERAAHTGHLRREVARFAALVSGGYPLVTTTIVVMCVALYVLGEYFGDGDHFAAIWRMGGNQGALVREGEIWRLFASTFLHGGLTHVAVNMFALLSLGRMLERVLGRARYLSLYGLSALGGALATASFNTAISVGASGAIWGVMTGGMALILRPRGLLPSLARTQMKKRMWMPLILNVSISFTPGIDYYAHFGGGIVGFLLVLSGASTYGVVPLWARESGTEKGRGNLLWGVIATLLALAMAGSVAMALWMGKPWELREPLTFERVSVGHTGISLELPRSLKPQATPTPIAKAPAHVYGSFPETPLSVQVDTAAMESALPEAEVERLLSEASAAQRHECKHPVQSPHIEAVGGRRFSVAQCRLGSNVMLFLYYTVVEDRQVHLTVIATADLPRAFQGAERRIAESLARTRD